MVDGYWEPGFMQRIQNGSILTWMVNENDKSDMLTIAPINFIFYYSESELKRLRMQNKSMIGAHIVVLLQVIW